MIVLIGVSMYPIRTAKDFRERFILPFSVLGIDLHMLVGNHDIYYKNTSEVNSLTELIGGKHKNIHIYEEATEVDFGGLTYTTHAMDYTIK